MERPECQHPLKLKVNTAFKLIKLSNLDLPKKHRARSIRNALFPSTINENTIQEQNSTTEELLPFLEMTPKNAKLLREIHSENARRKKRFVDGNRQLDLKIYCEKKFSYNCPTNLLTISMDWKNARDTIMQSDSRICCEGYSQQDGKCQKS